MKHYILFYKKLNKISNSLYYRHNFKHANVMNWSKIGNNTNSYITNPTVEELLKFWNAVEKDRSPEENWKPQIY